MDTRINKGEPMNADDTGATGAWDGNGQAVDPKELEKAKAEAAEAEDSITVHFKKPLEYMGKSYDKLTFDFEALTGQDGLDIENELLKLGKQVVVPAFSGEYLIRLAARACDQKIGADAFRFMRLADYNRVRSAARGFLLRSE